MIGGLSPGVGEVSPGTQGIRWVWPFLISHFGMARRLLMNLVTTTKEPVMSNLPAIDLAALQTVTGGGSRTRGSSNGNIDDLLKQLNSITDSISNISKKTSGFSSSQMMLLCVLAMQRTQPAGVVVVGPRRW